MFRVDLSKIARLKDDTVLKADTVDALQAKCIAHLSTKNPERWNAMSADEKNELKAKFASIAESK